MAPTVASLVVFLLAAPSFGDAVPADGWQPYAAREEIAPRSWSERDAQGALLLGLAGRGDDAVDGRWAREVPVVPGKTYAFGAAYRSQGVASPARSVLARLVWLEASGEAMRPMEYPLAGPPGPDGWTPVAGAYRAPEKAARARLEVHLRWTATGQVLWRDAVLREATLPAPRRVTLAAVYHRPRGTTSPGRAASVSSRSSRKPLRRGPTSSACPRGSPSWATASSTRRRPRRCRARAPRSSESSRSG